MARKGRRSLSMFFWLLPATKFSLNDTVPLSLLLTHPPKLSLSIHLHHCSLSLSLHLALGICCRSWMISPFPSLCPPSVSFSCVSLFFSILSHHATPFLSPPLVIDMSQSHIAHQLWERTFFNQRVYTRRTLHRSLWFEGALQGGNKLKSDIETWLVIFGVWD